MNIEFTKHIPMTIESDDETIQPPNGRHAKFAVEGDRAVFTFVKDDYSCVVVRMDSENAREYAGSIVKILESSS